MFSMAIVKTVETRGVGAMPPLRIIPAPELTIPAIAIASVYFVGASFAPLHSYPEKVMLLPEIQQQLIRSMGRTKPKLLVRSSGSTQADLIQTRSSEKGLTLLECLMAVTVMGLTISLVLPPLLIAAATRVQTRRAEQSLQIAQGEVDRIRNLVAINRHIIDALPSAVADSDIKAAIVQGQILSELRRSYP